MTNQSDRSASERRLGRGVYHLAEVARYTGLHPSRVRSWFKGAAGSANPPALCADYSPVRRDLAVSFLDLIDVAVAGRLRTAGVSMQQLRAAHRALQADLGTNHPFAHAEIYTDGKKVFSLAAERIDDLELCEAVSRQQFFHTITPMLEHIDYASSTQLAERWRIAEGVVIDPQRCFGKPSVEHTGASTYVLARALRANCGRTALVADLYDVSELAVEQAARFEAQSGSLAA